MNRRVLLGVRIALAFALALGVAAPLGGRAEAATNGTWDDVVIGTSNSFAGLASANNHVLFLGVSPNYAVDKTIYAVVSKVDAAGGTGADDGTARNAKVVRSTDGGQSWNAGVQVGSFSNAGTDVVTGLAVGDNGYVVLMTVSGVAGGTGRAFLSTNRGDSFVQYGPDLLSTAASAPLALAPNFSANGQILVGTDTGAVASASLFDQTRNAWSDVGLGLTGVGATKNGVVAIAFSPDYVNSSIGVLYAVGRVGGTMLLRAVRGLNAPVDVATLGGGLYERGYIRFDRGGYLYFGGSRISGGIYLGGIERVDTRTLNAVTSLAYEGNPSDAVSDFAIISGQGTNARIVVTNLNQQSAVGATALSPLVRWSRTGGIVGGSGQWESSDVDITGTDNDVAAAKPVIVTADGTVFVGNGDKATNDRGGIFKGKIVDNKLKFTHMGLSTTTAASVNAALSGVVASPNYASDRAVFVSTNEGLLRSSALTGTISSDLIGWSTVLPKPDLTNSGAASTTVAFDKVVFSPTYATDNTLYVFDRDTLYAWVSQDNGDTWKRVTTDVPTGWPGQNAAIKDMAVLGSRSVIVLTNDMAQPVAVSQDLADTWQGIGRAQGLTLDSTESLAVAGATYVVSGWVGTQVRVFISRDAGKTWTRLGANDLGDLSATPRVVLSPDYAQDGAVLLSMRDVAGGTAGDVYRSVQGGDWERINLDQTPDPTGVGQVLPVVRSGARIAYVLTSEAAGNPPRRVVDYLASNVLSPPIQFSDNTSDSLPAATGQWQVGHGQLSALLQGIAVGNDTTPLVLVAITGGTPSLRRLTDIGASQIVGVSPKDGAASDVIRPTFSWVGLPGMVRASPEYQLQYSRDPAFPSTGGNAVTEVWLNGETTSYVIPSTTTSPGLDKGFAYYWRVRVQNGVWSAGYRFAILDRPTLSQPENGKTVSAIRPTLAWTSVSGASRYQLQVSRDVRFQTDVTDRLFDQPALSWFPAEDLTGNTLYYWRVRAGTGDTWGDWTDPFAFLTPRSTTSPSPAPVPTVVPSPTPSTGSASPAPSTSTAVSVSSGFISIAGKYSVVWTFDGQTQSFKKFDPSAPAFVNTFSELRPGMGLWIVATDDTTLIWGQNSYKLYKGSNLIGWLPP